MMSLQLRMTLLLTALFGIIYAIIVVIGNAMGIGNFYVELALAFVLMGVQYMIGPKIVEWTMGVRYISREEGPELFAMVEDLAQRAGIPMPRICISDSQVPNAFAFGRGRNDGRVCVTRGIVQLLDREEMRAVLGHELTHLKNRDVVTITLLSVIPSIMWRITWQFMFFGSGRRDSRESGGGLLIGMLAFLFYFLSYLLVQYASRIREYYADQGSVELGNPPSALASALYKLVYGAARLPEEDRRQVEGLKAFFLNDVSQAVNDFSDLRQLDLDRSGTIDASELARLRQGRINVRGTDKLMELLSTHPNMLKRIKHLSELAG